MVSLLLILYVVLSRPEAAKALHHLYEWYELLRKVEPLLAMAMTGR